MLFLEHEALGLQRGMKQECSGSEQDIGLANMKCLVMSLPVTPAAVKADMNQRNSSL